MAEVVKKLDDDSRVVSVYYVINACKPNLLRERTKCQCKTRSQGGLLVANPTDAQIEKILEGPTQHLTSNEDVDTLNWMFIYIDTVRAPGFEHESSTKEEKLASRAVGNEVIAYLDSKGWPQPLLGDSGNGFHILPKINMLNTIHNIHLLVDCLKALAAKFDCAAAKIDSAVFNAARLTRAYGTTRERARIPTSARTAGKTVGAKGIIGKVSLDQILSLGSEVPVASRQTGNTPELHPKFDPDDCIEWYENRARSPSTATGSGMARPLRSLTSALTRATSTQEAASLGSSSAILLAITAFLATVKASR